MASLSKDGHGWRILFVCPTTRKRRTIRTGKCAKKNAETARHMIEKLIEAKRLASAIDPRAAAWLADVDDTLRGRLAKAGLVEESKAMPLETFLDAVIDQRVRRGDLEECTVVSWGHTRRNLITFFGADRPIDAITPADADEWAAWLVEHEDLAENTVRKRSANAKMFFKTALRRKQITENPFAALASSVVPSRGRQFFIPRETVTALLEQCRGPEYRLLLLFARYMGVRVPSEIVPLTWGDVDWETKRIVITSPKTKRHVGGNRRVTPLSPRCVPRWRKRSRRPPRARSGYSRRSGAGRRTCGPGWSVRSSTPVSSPGRGCGRTSGRPGQPSWPIGIPRMSRPLGWGIASGSLTATTARSRRNTTSGPSRR